MEKLLIECCEKMVNLLTLLKENGHITPEEYTQQIKQKQSFLNEYTSSTVCMSPIK